MAAHTSHTIHTGEYDEDMRRNEIQSTEPFMMRKIDFSTIPLGKGMRRRSKEQSQHRSILILIRQPKMSIDRHCLLPIDRPGVDPIREGYYSIGSWADDHHQESYAVETTIHEPAAVEMHEGFTNEELLNMQRRDEADRRAAIDREVQESIDRANRPSIDNNPPSSIDIRPKPSSTVSKNPNYDNQYLTQDEFGIFRDPDGYARAIDGHALHVSREDIADILQIAKGAEYLFMQQHNIPAYQQRVTKEFYDMAGGVDNRYKQKNRHHTRPSIDVDDPTSVDRRPEFGKRAYDRDGIRRFHWEKKDEYGVYRDDQGHATDVDGHTIRVSKDDRRRLLETASRDEPNYICLPEHASSFTQTMLVPEIYTKDEINEMFYGVCGAQEKNEGDFQIKLDGVYHPLNDSISWLTTCMEKMRQDIAKIQRAADVSRQASIDRNRPPSIDNRLPASVDDNLPQLHPMKFPPDFHTRVEIDQLIEDIYRTLESTEERLDRRCDYIYFPMDLTMSALTSQT
ncbi:hypothetical protein F2Q70_00035673 [Brassica cretica]|uniref:Uncharacterized protein n=1 Tax=Brassica cretica TaxID=69181 RepID=A0A8S9JSF2_BRACR|nr:hypothetical protein F2Q68_00030882 [Brassica cretica]KAF2584396.1 hypothetical protein F2Q70_00035673 [Brassica cretica]